MLKNKEEGCGVQSLKPLHMKRSRKQEREHHVLMALVDLYIQEGKPVGSATLKEYGFKDLSSATIRNYFVKLEKEGLLKQQHSSGGRIPTNEAFRMYAHGALSQAYVTPEDEEALSGQTFAHSQEIGLHLQGAVEKLSRQTNMVVFLSAPRFDNDFILHIKLLSIDHQRCVCVLVTDFGLIHTEVLHIGKKLSSFALRRLEQYFQWRLTGQEMEQALQEGEPELAQKIYNEVLVRYIVGYANFTQGDIYSAGCSELLNYPEFDSPETLIYGLSLFENRQLLQQFFDKCLEEKNLCYWLGEDLDAKVSSAKHCSLTIIPYSINQSQVGVISLLGPVRIPYPRLFGVLKLFSENLSESLTKAVFKYKISFRQPLQDPYYIEDKQLLLENKQREIDA